MWLREAQCDEGSLLLIAQLCFSYLHMACTVDAPNTFWEGISMDEARASKEVSGLVDFVDQV